LDKVGIHAEEQDRLLQGLQVDPVAAVATEVDRAMLSYALKLTRAPGEMTTADVESLRAVGFDDVAIHDICTIVAYFAFANRVADGLGVELEDRFAR
jgi:uncharacterized peroxidase-related enzyme